MSQFCILSYLSMCLYVCVIIFPCQKTSLFITLSHVPFFISSAKGWKSQATEAQSMRLLCKNKVQNDRWMSLF